ncbi:MAG TPA: helix-turn-helix transcriptional regulator [Thermoanaerobaculia bacterium]
MRHATRAGALFGARMREIRTQRGLTQKALAKRADLLQTHVSDLELGLKLPNLLTVIRIAVALGCTVAELTSALDQGDLRRMVGR